MSAPAGSQPVDTKRLAAIDAAVPVFRVHGYAGASISRLVEATGQSRSTLYAEFGDKGGLFTAALEHYCRQVKDEKLKSSVTRLSKREVGLPCLLTRSCLEYGDLPKESREIVADALEGQWIQLIDSAPPSSSRAEATRDLALRHGLAALAAAGVPTEELVAVL